MNATQKAALKRLRPPRPDRWLCGYACAMGAVARDSNYSVVRHAMMNDGITVELLTACGAEEFDLEPIRRAWK